MSRFRRAGHALAHVEAPWVPLGREIPRRRGDAVALALSAPDGQFCGRIIPGSAESQSTAVAQDVPIGSSHPSLVALNERSREIFRQIVDGYLATGEPMGSRQLSRIISMPLSPASVRNVMQDLEELGLIYAPHTSAGRLPTERGLRFFV